jgi:hypothetical protein
MIPNTQPVLQTLLASAETSIRYKARLFLLDEKPYSPSMKALREEIRTSPRVQTLLSERGQDGGIPFHPYLKWRGAHWVLSLLAELHYPEGDASLIPLREQEYGWLLSEHHENRIPTINGLVRRCASQESNAVFSLLKLGLADARCDELAHRLMKWQWPDGGWNCDKRPQAVNSSYYESWLPLRALHLYQRCCGDPQAKLAAERAAELLLKRELFIGAHSGRSIKPDFTQISFPFFFLYNILSALKVMVEIERIDDPRCQKALDLLESKRLPDGSFPAEGKYYRVAHKPVSRTSTVNWGPSHLKKGNEFVTLEALCVLKAARRL